MSNWQPIETAPKDGTRVLLWCAAERVAHIAKWYTERIERWERVDNDTQVRRVEDTGFWSYEGDRGWNWTHWQPLPDPPDAPVRGGQE